MTALLKPKLISAIAVFATVVGVAVRAHAHGMVGEREFPATLTIDDPAVKDEASVPTFIYSNGGSGTATSVNFEVDKRITETFGFGIQEGYTGFNSAGGSANRFGWQDLTTTLKYQAFASPAHEFLLSVGVIREWGGTGASAIGADAYGVTTPTVYFGKGLGDLPIGMLRPLAITGTLGYQVPDAANLNPQQLAVGFSIQYSMPYLEDAMHIKLPEFASHLVPLVEFNYAVPTRPVNGSAAVGTIAPGVIYSTETYQVGVEALAPGTRAGGTGAIAQLHVFFGELVPALGKPLF
jgi:hypothetical protein